MVRLDILALLRILGQKSSVFTVKYYVGNSFIFAFLSFFFVGINTSYQAEKVFCSHFLTVLIMNIEFCEVSYECSKSDMCIFFPLAC